MGVDAKQTNEVFEERWLLTFCTVTGDGTAFFNQVHETYQLYTFSLYFNNTVLSTENIVA